MISIRVIGILFFMQMQVSELYAQLGRLIPVGEYCCVGDVDSTDWEKMNDDERKMFLACLNECGLNQKSVKWLTLKTIDCLIKSDAFFSCKVVTKYNDSRGEGVEVNEGYYQLKEPECVVFIVRENGVSMVKLQMYY